MIKACLFDLYGILVSGSKCDSGIGTQEISGIPRNKSVDDLYPTGSATGLGPEEIKDRVWENTKSYFEYNEGEVPDRILPGALDFVKDLYRHGIKLASTATNCKPAEVLSSVGLYGMFSYIVDPKQVAARPSPEALLKAANHLGLSPEECVAFEETPEGIEAAKAAGMRSVAVGDLSILYHADMGVINLKGLTLMRINDALTPKMYC